MSEQTYIFHVSGMHCHACTVLISEEFKENGASEVKVDLSKNLAVVKGSFGNPNDAAQNLSALIEPHGYKLHLEKPAQESKLNEFIYALPLTALIIAGFVALQRIGLVNLVPGNQMSYGTAFIIGVVASLSTCLAVVGGLIISLSANLTKERSAHPVKSQTIFHMGRLIGFFILGGLIGILGEALQINAATMTILGLLLGLVMIVLGINLLDVWHGARKFQLRMPSFTAGILKKNKSSREVIAPFLLGAATFFLPCGFTQSMQFYSLTTGSFWIASFTMLIFALGTLPMLALLSFGFNGIAQKSWRGIFFKTAGLIVILLGLFNIINTLVAVGFINPIWNF